MADRDPSRYSNVSDYLKAMAVVTPVTLARSIGTGIPLSVADKLIETKVFNPKAPIIPTIQNSLRGRVPGRILGATLGISLSPWWFKSMRQMSSNDPSERSKGTKNFLASSAAFGLLTGTAADTVEGLAAKMSLKQSLKSGLAGATARTAIGLLPGLIIAQGIAESRRTGRKPKDAFERVVKPMLIASGVSGAVRGGEIGIRGLLRNARTIPTLRTPLSLILRKSLAAGTAGAATGAVGTLITKAVLDSMRAKK